MGILISFSGIDGAGKSTQIDLLSRYFEKKGNCVLVTEELFGYFLLRPVIGILRTATDSPFEGPVSRNRRFLPKLWFMPAFIDIWLGYIFKVQPLVRKYDLVIADRYYADIWANLLYYGYIPDWAFTFFLSLLPKPNVRMLLTVNPEIVTKREKDFGQSYYAEQAKIYSFLSKSVSFFEVDANQDKRKVFSRIKNVLETGGYADSK